MQATVPEYNTKGEEYVRCTVCDSDATTPLYQIPVKAYNNGRYARDVWPVVKCRSCGHIYCNPRIDAEARAAHYLFTNPGEREFVDDWFVHNADLHRAEWQRILRVIKRYKPQGKLLDLGCGPGHFLAEARAQGFQIAGQDISPVFREIAQRSHQIEVQAELSEVTARFGRDFDVVTSFDVIEHHDDPSRMVREIRALMKPGGILVMTTHDIGNWFARMYGPNWRHLNPIGHLNYFTRGTLGKLLRRNGFRIERWGGWHTIEARQPQETVRWIVQLVRVILVRALLIWGFKPLAERIPALRNWEIKRGDKTINYRKLMVRVGDQIIMNDDMVVVARAI